MALSFSIDLVSSAARVTSVKSQTRLKIGPPVLVKSPALVVWTDHSAGVDQNQIKWSVREFLVIGKNQAKYKYK